MGKKKVLTPSDLGINSSSINRVLIGNMSWQDFKGQAPQNPPYYAHVFWNLNYTYSFTQNGKYVSIKVLPRTTISHRSWCREQHTSDRLLQHQYGHYLIGCLCALEFQAKIEKESKLQQFTTQKEALRWCYEIFNQSLCQFLEMEKKYDEDTNHYYNVDEQAKWEAKITTAINSHIGFSIQKRTKSERGASAGRKLSVQSIRQDNNTCQKQRDKLAIKSSRNIPYIPLPRRVEKKQSERLPDLANKQNFKKNSEKTQDSPIHAPGNNKYRIKSRRGSLDVKRVEIMLK